MSFKETIQKHIAKRGGCVIACTGSDLNSIGIDFSAYDSNTPEELFTLKIAYWEPTVDCDGFYSTTVYDRNKKEVYTDDVYENERNKISGVLFGWIDEKAE